MDKQAPKEKLSLADLAKKNCRKCHGRGYTAIRQSDQKKVICKCALKTYQETRKEIISRSTAVATRNVIAEVKQPWYKKLLQAILRTKPQPPVLDEPEGYREIAITMNHRTDIPPVGVLRIKQEHIPEGADWAIFPAGKILEKAGNTITKIDLVSVGLCERIDKRIKKKSVLIDTDKHTLGVEALARQLHESGRAAVEKGATVAAGNLGDKARRFLEWDEITEEAREGRRMQAAWLLDRYFITDHLGR